MVVNSEKVTPSFKSMLWVLTKFVSMRPFQFFKILDLSTMKAFAENKISITENLHFNFER